MKNLVKRVFSSSIGKILRLFQFSLVNRNEETVLSLINQNAIHSSAQYAIKNFGKAMQFDARSKLWSYCLNTNLQLQFSSGKIIAEFGVWQGESINFFARNCPNARLFGFDSFEGLEEDWYGYKLHKGLFSTNGKLPKVEKNVTLIKGWFEDTLPKFINELDQEKISVLHMDADTYKPTKYVLNALIPHLTSGSIIIFDEYFGYSNWELHEFKAFSEVVKSYGVKYKYIGHTNMQVAVEIL
jgi:predicted O-methyltransferase YrrM